MSEYTEFLAEDLLEKQSDIESIIKLAKLMDDNDYVLTQSGNYYFSFSSQLSNSLKSSIYLMLYNAVESTLRECINLIHDQLDSKVVEFDSLREKLKREILKRIQNSHVGLDRLIARSNPLTSKIHRGSYNKNKVFSGNIDRQEISNLALIYGFNSDTSYERTKHGSTLNEVKKKRNDLAHGNISFRDASSQDSVADLTDLSQYTINYLLDILDNVNDYLNDSDYLDKD